MQVFDLILDWTIKIVGVLFAIYVVFLIIAAIRYWLGNKTQKQNKAFYSKHFDSISKRMDKEIAAAGGLLNFWNEQTIWMKLNGLHTNPEAVRYFFNCMCAFYLDQGSLPPEEMGRIFDTLYAYPGFVPAGESFAFGTGHTTITKLCPLRNGRYQSEEFTGVFTMTDKSLLMEGSEIPWERAGDFKFEPNQRTMSFKDYWRINYRIEVKDGQTLELFQKAYGILFQKA